MLKKRIIPCLDIKDGRVVKGVHFNHLTDAGDPLSLSKKYAEEGADELVLLDITATTERRKTIVQLVREIAGEIDIPFTVGGGISTVADVRVLLEAGADKVSVNSAAIMRPELLTELATEFGSQCVVLAIDTDKVDDRWEVFRSGGKLATGWEALEWAIRGVALGAGELLLTSMEQDGSRKGFSLDITGKIASGVNVPVIASGGAGDYADFARVFAQTAATGALAASVFHYGHISVSRLKQYLIEQQIPVRYDNRF